MRIAVVHLQRASLPSAAFTPTKTPSMRTLSGAMFLNSVGSSEQTLQDSMLISPTVFFFNTTNPYLDPGTPDLAGLLASGYLNSYGLQHQRQWDLDPRFQNRHDIPSELHSHGLEALSAAALYSPPKANMISRPKPSGRSEHDNPLGPSSSLQRHDEQSTSTGLAISSSKNLNFLLNPTPTMDSPIDPNLMASALNQAPHAEEPSSSHKTANGEHLAGEAESEQKVAYLLRHFSDTPGQ